MRKHVLLQVFGRVQGVGFRYHTHEKATSLNLVGYVQNKRDGSVVIEAEGEEESLDHFIAWCQTGPEHAKIDRIETEDLPVGNHSSFEVIL